MNVLKVFWITGTFFFLIAKGCVEKDTCNQGVTFADIYVGDIASDSTMTAEIEIIWSTNRQLPLEYFQAIQIYRSDSDPYGKEWQNDWQAIDSILVAEFGKFSLHLYASIPSDSTKQFSFHLSFPDRKGYIDCEHPGAPDSYRLDISMKLNYDDNNRLAVTDFNWNEQLMKGGF